MLLARPFGQEMAQAFRRLVDYAVSKNDQLFEYATGSEEAVTNIHAFQAWGAWIIYGLVAALIAMWITRWLAHRPVSWVSIMVVMSLWATIYLLVWRWDSELQFALGRASDGGIGQTWGAWPNAGSIGYFGGFIIGLVFAAAPWRVGNKT